ncbi:MAG: beta-1,6-N-acetylglucosaminyltransferase, partial [Bacteroidota bacterium]
MKQGILITAYKDFHQLIKLATFFDERFSVYIHMDKKSDMPGDVETQLKSIPSVALVSRKYSVNWGGRNHLLSILHLVEESLKDPEIGYCHLITGQDFPTRSNNEFVNFFQKHSEIEYLEHFTMPAACWNHGGMDRIQYYNLYDLLNAKRSMKAIARVKRLQVKLGIKRSLSTKLPPLYGGSTYWSLSRKA